MPENSFYMLCSSLIITQGLFLQLICIGGVCMCVCIRQGQKEQNRKLKEETWRFGEARKIWFLLENISVCLSCCLQDNLQCVNSGGGRSGNCTNLWSTQCCVVGRSVYIYLSTLHIWVGGGYFSNCDLEGFKISKTISSGENKNQGSIDISRLLFCSHSVFLFLPQSASYSYS